MDTESEEEDWEIHDKLQDICGELVAGTDLIYAVPGEEPDTALIGLPYSKLNDDETGRQFKERAQKFFDEKIGKIKLSFIETEVYE